MVLCKGSESFNVALRIHQLSDEKGLALCAAIKRAFSDTGVQQNEWQNEGTVAAVFDGQRSLLKTCGSALCADMPWLFVLYCVMHRVARVDTYVFAPKKRETLPPDVATAQKSFRECMDVINRVAKLMNQSSKFRAALDATASAHGIKCWQLARLQKTRMLRSRTRTVSSFVLNLPVLLRFFLRRIASIICWMTVRKRMHGSSAI